MAEQRYREILESIEVPQHSRGGTFERVLEIADGSRRGRALDAPCGPGRMAEALSRLGFEAFGLDFDRGAYRASSPFCVADLERPLPYVDGSFAFVYCGDGIEHVENPFAVMRELSRVLAEDGRLVVMTPNYSNVERRLQFLLTGSVAKPPTRVSRYDVSWPYDRGHISPLPLARLAYAGECAGLALEQTETLLVRKGQRWLAPLALLIRVVAATASSERKRHLFADHSQTWRMLMGGKQLLAVFRPAGRGEGSGAST